MSCWTFRSTRTLASEGEESLADARAGGSPSRPVCKGFGHRHLCQVVG